MLSLESMEGTQILQRSLYRCTGGKMIIEWKTIAVILSLSGTLVNIVISFSRHSAMIKRNADKLKDHAETMKAADGNLKAINRACQKNQLHFEAKYISREALELKFDNLENKIDEIGKQIQYLNSNFVKQYIDSSLHNST